MNPEYIKRAKERHSQFKRKVDEEREKEESVQRMNNWIEYQRQSFKEYGFSEQDTSRLIIHENIPTLLPTSEQIPFLFKVTLSTDNNLEQFEEKKEKEQ